jgi:hypothetical protein
LYASAKVDGGCLFEVSCGTTQFTDSKAEPHRLDEHLAVEDKIIKLRDRYEALFRKAVAACVAQRVFRDMNVKITTLALLGMMNWLIHWYAPDGPMNTAEIARIFSDLFLKRPRR